MNARRAAALFRRLLAEALRDVPRLVEAHGAERVSRVLSEYAALVVLVGTMARVRLPDRDARGGPMDKPTTEILIGSVRGGGV